MPDNPCGDEIFFPNIQVKPPLAQPGTISSFVTWEKRPTLISCQGAAESDKVSPER